MMWIPVLTRSRLVFATKLLLLFTFFPSLFFFPVNYTHKYTILVYTIARDSPIEAHLAPGLSDKYHAISL